VTLTDQSGVLWPAQRGGDVVCWGDDGFAHGATSGPVGSRICTDLGSGIFDGSRAARGPSHAWQGPPVYLGLRAISQSRVYNFLDGAAFVRATQGIESAGAAPEPVLVTSPRVLLNVPDHNAAENVASLLVEVHRDVDWGAGDSRGTMPASQTHFLEAWIGDTLVARSPAPLPGVAASIPLVASLPVGPALLLLRLVEGKFDICSGYGVGNGKADSDTCGAKRGVSSLLAATEVRCAPFPDNLAPAVFERPRGLPLRLPSIPHLTDTVSIVRFVFLATGGCGCRPPSPAPYGFL
jgi:hypothetical protein